MNKINYLGLYVGFFVVGFLCAYGVGKLSQYTQLSVHSITNSSVQIERASYHSTTITLLGNYYQIPSRSDCTNSMLPMLGCNNTILMRPLDQNESPSIGDVVTLTLEDGSPARHQIIDYHGGENCYITKGINNFQTDPYCVPRSQIHEKLIAVVYT